MRASATLGLFAITAFVLGCMSEARKTGPAPAPTETQEEAEPTMPPPGADAATEAAPVDGDLVLDGCTVKRVTDPDLCAEECGARLLLPGKNGSYCTIPCASDAECGALACPETVGACMPRCTSDAACKSAGFARCDPATGACDTI